MMGDWDARYRQIGRTCSLVLSASLAREEEIRMFTRHAFMGKQAKNANQEQDKRARKEDNIRWDAHLLLQL